MTSIAAPLKRYTSLLLTLLVTAVVTLTMLVAAPKADAYGYKWHCKLANQQVHRGDRDAAFCVNGHPRHHGRAYVKQREVQMVGRPHHRHKKVVHKTYVLDRYTTNRAGTATVHFRIPRALHSGWHWITLTCGKQPPAHVHIHVRRG